MQTNPLYVSQLARHVKVPLYGTVQDYAEELFRCQMTPTSSKLNICQVPLYSG